MTQWPDPNKPGYPVNASEDGWHWIRIGLPDPRPIEWDSETQSWEWLDDLHPAEQFVSRGGIQYYGPCIPYADVFTAGARAAREMDVAWLLRVAETSNNHDEYDNYNMGFCPANKNAADAIQSLPLPEPAGSKTDQEQNRCESKPDGVPDAAQSKHDQSVDLSGFEALADNWINGGKRLNNGEWFSFDCEMRGYYRTAGEELRAEIAKLKGK